MFFRHTLPLYLILNNMLILKSLSIVESMDALKALPEGKLLINTINAHSYNTAQKDKLFAEALVNGDALIPDGASIVKACKWLNAQSKPTCRPGISSDKDRNVFTSL